MLASVTTMAATKKSTKAVAKATPELAKTRNKDQTDIETAFCIGEVLIKMTCETHSERYEAAVNS